MNILLGFILCSALKNVFGEYQGDSCYTNKGTQGTCKLVTQCQSAIRDIKLGILPKICGFEGHQSIVCCLDTCTTGTTEVSVITTTRLSHNRYPGDVSKAKCLEYAKYAYEEESPLLSTNRQSVNFFHCVFYRQMLIVGGVKAPRQEFPHMAEIGYVTGDGVIWACAGSLISENFVLTAGRCLKNTKLGSATLVRIGITNHLQERFVSERIRYPDYAKQNHHDIGLLKVDTNFDLKTYLRPACLQTEYNMPYIQRAIATSWGNTTETGSDNKDLLRIVLELFSSEKCNSTYKSEETQPYSPLDNGMLENMTICAGSRSELTHICQIDFGSPLQIYHEETKDIKCMYSIIGVRTFGNSCGLNTNDRLIFTRVSAYIKWIEDIVWP